MQTSDLLCTYMETQHPDHQLQFCSLWCLQTQSCCWTPKQQHRVWLLLGKPSLHGGSHMLSTDEGRWTHSLLCTVGSRGKTRQKLSREGCIFKPHGSPQPCSCPADRGMDVPPCQSRAPRRPTEHPKNANSRSHGHCWEQKCEMP